MDFAGQILDLMSVLFLSPAGPHEQVPEGMFVHLISQHLPARTTWEEAFGGRSWPKKQSAILTERSQSNKEFRQFYGHFAALTKPLEQVCKIRVKRCKQLAESGIESGSKGRTRTYNRSVNSRLLYH
jgi:hypothetical protein